MFNGLSENHFKLIEPIMEEWANKNRVGRKPHPWRPVLNSIFWVLTTGTPWWTLPKGKNFAHRSTAHSWLGKMEKDGIEEILSGLIEIAEMIGGVDPERLSIDVFFQAEEVEENKLNMVTKVKELQIIYELKQRGEP